jgi:DNA-binding NarL/FixJ family response regulator
MSDLRSLRAESERLRLESLKIRIDLSLTMASFVHARPQNEGLRVKCRRNAEKAYHSVLTTLAHPSYAETDTAELAARLDRLRSVLHSLGLDTAEEPVAPAPPPRLGPVPVPHPSARTMDSLTARETEVLRCVALGHSTKEVAYLLGISFKTAACHRYRVMDKLGIHDVVNLTRYAIREGLVRP